MSFILDLIKNKYVFYALISFIISIFVSYIVYGLKNRKSIYIGLYNTENYYYFRNKNVNLEKTNNYNDNIKYVECNYELSFFNDSTKPFYMRNIYLCKKIKGEYIKLEECKINVNGTLKRENCFSYDKLNNVMVNAYEGKDYDINFRLSNEEYKISNKIYLCYRGKKNKLNYIKIKIKK